MVGCVLVFCVLIEEFWVVLDGLLEVFWCCFRWVTLNCVCLLCWLLWFLGWIHWLFLFGGFLLRVLCGRIVSALVWVGYLLVIWVLCLINVFGVTGLSFGLVVCLFLVCCLLVVSPVLCWLWVRFVGF